MKTKKEEGYKRENRSTFVGLRPMVVESKKKKALKREKLKASLRNELRDL